MRPQRFILTASLPLTATGKVARGELSQVTPLCEAWEQPQPLLQGLEMLVASLWAEELAQPLRSISRRSHFLELGGHSIAALRVCRRLLVQLGMASSDGGTSGLNRDDDALGGALGELTGPLAPSELLARPQLSSYVNHLRSAGLDANMPQGEHVVSDAEVPVLPDLSEPMPAGGEDEEEGVVDLLHAAAACGSVCLIDFLISQGHAGVDGRSRQKRLKVVTSCGNCRTEICNFSAARITR